MQVQKNLLKYFDVRLLLEFLRLAGPLSPREWAFFIAKQSVHSSGADSFIVRYMSVTRPSDLGVYMARQRVLRVEVGAIHTGPMISTPMADLIQHRMARNDAARARRAENRRKEKQKQRGNGFFAKELVFDIDADDYDGRAGLRKCDCPGNKRVCDRCWPLVVTSARILDAILRHQMGFDHALWVFSGRRGVHCWVTGPQVCRLDETQRKSIATCIASFFDDSLSWKAVATSDTAASIEQAVRAGWPLLARRHGLSAVASSNDMWDRAAVLRPRIDEAVTAKTSHLIKLPFSPHPATHRFALPFDVWSDDALRSVDAISPTADSATFREKYDDARRCMQRFIVSVQGGS